MAKIVAFGAVVAVAALTLAALWRFVRSLLLLQADPPEADEADEADERSPRALRRRQVLHDERDRQLRGLREIEFDHQTGKIGERDYRELRRRHELAAAAAIRALDRFEQAADPAPGEKS